MDKKTISKAHSAVFYQALYLTNLLLLPALSFVYLIYCLYFTEVKSKFVKIHLIRAVQISALAGLMLIIIPLFVIYFSPQFEASLMVMIFYIVTLHAGFVLIGMLNLSRAMAKKLPIF